MAMPWTMSDDEGANLILDDLVFDASDECFVDAAEALGAKGGNIIHGTFGTFRDGEV